MTLDFWRTLALGSAALGQTLFVGLYLTFPWWRSFTGRALFYKGLTLAVLLDLIILARVWPWLRFQDVLFIILYASLAVGIWWQTLAFLRVKVRGRARMMREHVVTDE